MTIDSKEKWIETATKIVPMLPEYMAAFSGGVEPIKVEMELTGLLERQDWKMLYQRFSEIWAWLPDNRSIRHGPFFELRIPMDFSGVKSQ